VDYAPGGSLDIAQVYEEGQDRALKLKEQGQSAAQKQIDEAQG
jgi:hypothetical protein